MELGLGTVTTGIGDTGTVDKQNTSSGSGRVPGCTKGGAHCPSGLSAICRGKGQLCFELRVKPGREIPDHSAGEKVGNGAGV